MWVSLTLKIFKAQQVYITHTMCTNTGDFMNLYGVASCIMRIGQLVTVSLTSLTAVYMLSHKGHFV